MQNISITTEFTPNPNSLKFNVSVPICTHGTVHFASKAEAGKSPLAAKLFEIENVKEVMIGSDLVTVTRDEKVQSWNVLIPRVTATIREFLACGKTSPKACEQCMDATNPKSEIERKIIAIMDEHGNLKLYRRMDGTPLISVRMSQLKALTSSSFPISSKELAERNLAFENGPYLAVPGLVLLEGGLPIITKEGQHVGSIGVSGSTPDKDGLCAQAGLDRLKGLASLISPPRSIESSSQASSHWSCTLPGSFRLTALPIL